MKTSCQVNYNEKQLACAVILQAAKDYCDPKASPQKKGKILKDLQKNHLFNAITDDLGIHTAEQLKLHEDEIADRLGIIIKEEEKTEEMLC
jgi:hypothetical protein